MEGMPRGRHRPRPSARFSRNADKCQCIRGYGKDRLTLYSATLAN